MSRETACRTGDMRKEYDLPKGSSYKSLLSINFESNNMVHNHHLKDK